MEVDAARRARTRPPPGAATSRYDYVKINADYTSLIVQPPDGRCGARTGSRTTAPPSSGRCWSRRLTYISRFSGTRCVIKYGGAALGRSRSRRPSATTSSCSARSGCARSWSTAPSGRCARTEAASTAPVTMPDVGRRDGAHRPQHRHLVTLLNQDGGRAVGVSGKDGPLLRAVPVVSDPDLRPGIGEVREVNRRVPRDAAREGLRAGHLSGRHRRRAARRYTCRRTGAAAEVAIALGRQKLIYLPDVRGWWTAARSEASSPCATSSTSSPRAWRLRRTSRSSSSHPPRARRRRGAGPRPRRAAGPHRHRRALHRPRRRHAGDRRMRPREEQTDAGTARRHPQAASAVATVATQEELRPHARRPGLRGHPGDALPRPGSARRPARSADRGRQRLRAPPEGSPAAPGLLEALDPLVLAVRGQRLAGRGAHHPGAASAVARAIDRRGCRRCLGTLAGDDTIFVAPPQAQRSASRLAARPPGDSCGQGAEP